MSEILNRLTGGPIPARPAHLRASVAELLARLATQSQEQRNELVKSVQDVYERVVSAPQDLHVHGGSGQEGSLPGVARPALEIVHEPAAAQEKITKVKFVVAGSGGSGKTTFMRTIANEVMALSEKAGSIDFGTIMMQTDLHVYLF